MNSWSIFGLSTAPTVLEAPSHLITLAALITAAKFYLLICDQSLKTLGSRIFLTDLSMD